MQVAGRWLDAWLRYVRAHWRDHLWPGLVLGLVTSFAPLFALGAALAIVLAAVPPERLACLMVWTRECGITRLDDEVALLRSGSMAMLVVAGTVLATQPLVLGYLRGTLRSVRGEPFALSDLAWGYRRVREFLLLSAGTQVALLAGLALLVLPALWLFPIVALGPVALADRDLGARDALATAWRVGRRTWGALAAWDLVVLIVVGILSSVPVLGWIYAFPALLTMQAVSWVEKVDAGTVDA